jgi:hypothetical protein
LWVLGILASCGSGNGGGGGGGGGGNVSNTFQGGGGSPDFPQLEQFFNSVDETVWIALIVAIILVFLLLAIVALVLGIMGQAGLIHGFDQADEGEMVGLVSAFKGGLDYFLRLLGLKILLLVFGILLTIAILITVLPMVILTLGIGLLCLIPLICLLIPLGIAFSVYIQISQIAIVVEDIDIFAGLRRGWEVLRGNLGSLVVMALILVLGGGIIGLLLALPFIALIIPIIAGLGVGTDASMGIGLGVAALGFLVYLPVVIVLSGILQTYLQGAWTITYRRLTGQSGASELAK